VKRRKSRRTAGGACGGGLQTCDRCLQLLRDGCQRCLACRCQPDCFLLWQPWRRGYRHLPACPAFASHGCPWPHNCCAWLLPGVRLCVGPLAPRLLHHCCALLGCRMRKGAGLLAPCVPRPPHGCAGDSNTCPWGGTGCSPTCMKGAHIGPRCFHPEPHVSLLGAGPFCSTGPLLAGGARPLRHRSRRCSPRRPMNRN
jgi:hypothetical protein